MNGYPDDEYANGSAKLGNCYEEQWFVHIPGATRHHVISLRDNRHFHAKPDQVLMLLRSTAFANRCATDRPETVADWFAAISMSAIPHPLTSQPMHLVAWQFVQIASGPGFSSFWHGIGSYLSKVKFAAEP